MTRQKKAGPRTPDWGGLIIDETNEKIAGSNWKKNESTKDKENPNIVRSEEQVQQLNIW